MPTDGKVVTLFEDKENTVGIFPRTKVSAVSDDNGVSLERLLQNAGGNVETDAVLDETSTNPIQNKAVAQAIGDIDYMLNVIIDGNDFDAQLDEILGV